LGAKLSEEDFIMTTTFIDTNKIKPVTRAGEPGTYAEVLNNDLCGAQNVVGALRWLGQNESLAVECDADTHQVVYLMEGQGEISLNGTGYEVRKGAGVYLGPTESADIRQTGSEPLKLFHLRVPSQQN
jgi:mannose-6-phosphate isomerase-like protein (cupin superfamily)